MRNCLGNLKKTKLYLFYLYSTCTLILNVNTFIHLYLSKLYYFYNYSVFIITL